MILYSSVHQMLTFSTSVFHYLKQLLQATIIEFSTLLVIYIIMYLLKTRILLNYLPLLKDRADKWNFHPYYLLLCFITFKMRWVFSF